MKTFTVAFVVSALFLGAVETETDRPPAATLLMLDDDDDPAPLPVNCASRTIYDYLTCRNDNTGCTTAPKDYCSAKWKGSTWPFPGVTCAAGTGRPLLQNGELGKKCFCSATQMPPRTDCIAPTTTGPADAPR